MAKAKKGGAKRKTASRAKGRPARVRKAAPRVRPRPPSVDVASRIVKEAAARQRIVISLTEEQFEELNRSFRPEGGGVVDPRRPFQIEFQAAGAGRSRLPVASCAFWSDTCCA